MTAHDEPDRARVRADAPLDTVRFMDSSGVHWQVWERDTRNDPGAPAGACLIFVCDDVIRRAWIYPAAWRELGPEALAELSWSR